ncbi:hypothetical protein BFP76_10770 [Amylibacter kogurei]|uniref:CobQ/CobB/MinD/ParA nucleotide binding domain-containing protein n=1 Tax=Paramylibacter kogurei TaxID=1889778 RepID=A0A2G5KB39_9RHOB|nr:CpsD/CapB family tyrosine-protein kinase [Amylibacter kogurei]PIB26731.1 hypothetical protein BFP76_10770 [Amylibacter kogurei]
MERLQAAINKARAQRKTGVAATEHVQSKTTDKKLVENWERLAPVVMDPKQSAMNRLSSIGGGRDAAPYDMLRTRILQQASANKWRRVAVVSPHSGCGKSTTCANLAFSFSRQRDLRTMVLDLDLRRVGLSRILGQPRNANMADVLQANTDFLDHGMVLNENVALGLNQTSVHDASEILQNMRTKSVLENIENQLRPDIVLFDMPPLMSTDDNYGFLPNVDCAILIAEAEKTTIAQIDVAERQLAELTNVMGVVLNKSRYHTGAYGYDYDYK